MTEWEQAEDIKSVLREQNRHLDRIADNLGSIANYLMEIKDSMPITEWHRVGERKK